MRIDAIRTSLFTATACLALAVGCNAPAERASDESNVVGIPEGPTVEDFLAGADVEEFVHPSYGLTVRYRPGAMDAVARYATVAQLAEEHPWLAEQLQGNDCEARPWLPELSCNPEAGYACESDAHCLSTETCSDGFCAPTGCFADAIEGYDGTTSIMQLHEEYEIVDYSDEEFATVGEIESFVETKVVIIDRYLSLYFGRVDGELYLLFVDAAEQDCSA